MNPTTIRFYHRTSIPKDSLVQIIFSTENFQRGIDGWGTNTNNITYNSTTYKEGDFFGKGFLILSIKVLLELVPCRN